ncbi:IPT/TIG domain-containing protein [Blastococcus brunescens]|uniref:IPT/TIG domain-containing protein n=1 Tax=Blastococcus brunescens TaxID=1564165 RepID=UPI003BEED439
MVDVEGGTVVTIDGLALPADPTVRIGSTATATVVRATTTRLTFRVPARVAGVYDVSVFAPDGRSTVLSNALTYASGVGTTPDDGTAGSPDDGTGATPPGSTAPGTPLPADPTPVTAARRPAPRRSSAPAPAVSGW